VVILTLNTSIMFLVFTFMHFWMWGFLLRRWYSCALTTYKVVRDCLKFEKHWSGVTNELLLRTSSSHLFYEWNMYEQVFLYPCTRRPKYISQPIRHVLKPCRHIPICNMCNTINHLKPSGYCVHHFQKLCILYLWVSTLLQKLGLFP
jgi:hypothetical protein